MKHIPVQMFLAVALLQGQSQIPAAAAASDEATKLVTAGFEFLNRQDAQAAEEAFRKAIEVQAELGEAHRGSRDGLVGAAPGGAAERELEQAVKLCLTPRQPTRLSRSCFSPLPIPARRARCWNARVALDARDARSRYRLAILLRMWASRSARRNCSRNL